MVHPNIVRVLDAGEYEGSPYLVMEYVEGGKSLGSFCNEDNLLPAAGSGNWSTMQPAPSSIPTAKALSTGCQPSNILLTPRAKPS